MSDFQLLHDFALLHISGADSERFLQGQLTCDVVALNDQQWTLGACCNAKGRMVANFVIAKVNNEFWLRVAADQVAALQQHLSRYIVFFKATMHSHLDQRVWGNIDALSEQPQRLSEARPVAVNATTLLLTWPDGRLERWCLEAQPEAATTSLHTQQAWHEADIRQGLVWVTQASHLEWLPQDIDWPQQGGVSFSKGCYTGQEIVARLQFLGKSKKQLIQLSSAEVLTASILSTVFDKQKESVGQLVAWQQQQGLAIVNKEVSEPLLYIADQPLQWNSLFYQTDTAPHQE